MNPFRKCLSAAHTISDGMPWGLMLIPFLLGSICAIVLGSCAVYHNLPCTEGAAVLSKENHGPANCSTKTESIEYHDLGMEGNPPMPRGTLVICKCHR